MQYKSLFYLGSLVAVALGASVSDVLTDIGNAVGQTATLDNAINSFPNSGGTLDQALAVHNDAVALVSDLDKTTADAKTLPTPVSVTDGNSLLAAVKSAQPFIQSALTDIVAKKSAIVGLPLGGLGALVLQDLTNLNASTSALEVQLISRAPTADIRSQAQTIANQISQAFATAIAAFSS